MSWKNLIGFNHKEFINEPLKVVLGEIPYNFRGTLYKNTAAMLKRKNGIPGHMFDGDGAILKVQFDDQKAISSYKYIKTSYYLEEEKVDGNNKMLNEFLEFIYPAIGRTPSGGIFQRLKNLLNFKNNGNINLLPVEKGGLLALYEGGHPHLLNKQSLDTIGLDNLSQLNNFTAFHAHPKKCSKTNTVYNIGLETTNKSKLHIYKLDGYGKIAQKNSVEIESGTILIHDFILAGQYIVVPLNPVRNKIGLGTLMGRQTIGSCVKFLPEKGVEIIIFDQATLKLVNKIKTQESYFVFHYANGFVDSQGRIVYDQAGYKDFNMFYNLFSDNLLKNGFRSDCFPVGLERITIDPVTGSFNKTLRFKDKIEFPIIDDTLVGQQHQDIYCTAFQNEWQNGVIKYSNDDKLARFYDEQYVSEVNFIQNANKPKGQGWLILTLYDGKQHKSFVEILDSNNLDTVCRLETPEVLAYSFHGFFEQN